MKNYWNIAVFFSILFHTIILVALPSFNKKIFSPKKNEEKPQIKLITQHIEDIKRFEKRTEDIKIKNNEPKPLPYVENIMTNLKKKNSFTQIEKPKIFNKNIDEIIFSERIDNNELKNNAAYTNYYKIIREKIRLSTYQNYNLRRNGEVMLSFLILSDGSLQDIECSSDSAVNKSLTKIALNSVKQSAPFPIFPFELKKYSHLKFNISIQFKN